MSGGVEDLFALLSGDMVPVEGAQIPVQALEAISAELARVGGERTGTMDSHYRQGYVEGRHELVRTLAEIIKRELAPAIALREKLQEGLG
jgi:hypothetical protein